MTTRLAQRLTRGGHSVAKGSSLTSLQLHPQPWTEQLGGREDLDLPRRPLLPRLDGNRKAEQQVPLETLNWRDVSLRHPRQPDWVPAGAPLL